MPVMETKTIKVRGMSCQHCVNAIKQNVGKVPGVDNVDVSLQAGTVTVSYDAEKTNMEAIEGAIAGAGYDIDKGD